MTTSSLPELRKVEALLARQIEAQRRIKEIDSKVESLRNERGEAERELEAIKAKLGELSEFVEAAKSVAQFVAQVYGKTEAEVLVENRNYVSNSEKRELLQRILADFQRQHPEAKGMTFQEILEVLNRDFRIQTRTIGNFFKNQLHEYKTEGGNRRKYVIFSDRKKGDE